VWLQARQAQHLPSIAGAFAVDVDQMLLLLSRLMRAYDVRLWTVCVG
jgi:hypothetical protein